MPRIPRIFCPELPDEGAGVTLPDGASRHVVKVLRMGTGDALRLFDGRGREHDATIVEAAGRRARVTLLAAREPAAESPLKVSLLQAVGRGERMDLVVQKATELGVRSIVPVLSNRSMVKLEGERADRRRSHWESVAAGACEQCGRAFLPEIAAPCTLETALGQTPADWTRLTPDPAAEQPMAALDPPGIGLAVLIGPEGGLDDGERSLAEAAGFQPVRLGPRVLRTETAAIAGLALAQGLWGDLRR
jgi:16S rRNA (uracil1498-N3)-methyltransferase